jgi:hypothetical protein
MGNLVLFQAFLQELFKDETIFSFAVFLSLALSVLSFVSLIVCAFFYAAWKRKRKKARKAERARRVEFALPEKDNSFIRERLFSVLQDPKNKIDPKQYTEENLQITYVQDLFVKLSTAPLSVAERLSVEDTAKLLKAVFSRGKWTAEELRIMNDCFSSLLKISAKYAV